MEENIEKISRECLNQRYLSQPMRFWYLSHRRPAKAQASLRIRVVSPEPSLFAHIKYGSRRRVRPKIRESGSFRPLSRSPLSRFAHFPFRSESFRLRVVSPTFPFAPESFHPPSRSPLNRFAHFPVRPRVVSPPYKRTYCNFVLRCAYGKGNFQR